MDSPFWGQHKNTIFKSKKSTRLGYFCNPVRLLSILVSLVNILLLVYSWPSFHGKGRYLVLLLWSVVKSCWPISGPNTYVMT